MNYLVYGIVVPGYVKVLLCQGECKWRVGVAMCQFQGLVWSVLMARRYFLMISLILGISKF